VVAAVIAAPLFAQDTTVKRLPAVTVTREKARSPMELPMAISSTMPDSTSPGQPHTMPEQTLSLLPGVTVANRTNPSQDARISIRGFGARSQFGVRSLRILRDGMPLTMADGQTPIDYVDLEAVSRVETIRGSASSLYGNASGGVIDLRSPAPPSERVAGQARLWAGSNGFERSTVLFGGTTPYGWYQFNVGKTQSDGVRDYSEQVLTNRFLRAGTEWKGTQITLVGLAMDMPTANNPGALTRIQYDTNPTMADPLSIGKQARKAVDQLQAGLSASRAFRGDGEWYAQVYGSARALHNPLTFSIVGIDRHTNGGALRATLPVSIGGMTHRVTAGLDAQRLVDLRKNWANCNQVLLVDASCPTLPAEQGALSLSQHETVTSFGPYLRDEIERGRARLTLGVRADNIMYKFDDHFFGDSLDDSGERTMSAVSPMIGLALRFRDSHSGYVNVSTAFESPTTTEIGNQPDSTSGLNPTIEPQKSVTFEVGARGFAFGRVQYDVAIFSTAVRDELIPFDIGNGRNSFRNAGKTTRRGLEGAFGTEFGPLSVNGVYSFAHFEFDDFVVGTIQRGGNNIPGIPEHQGQLSASYRHRYGFALVEWVGKDRIEVNDANAVRAPGYALVNVRAGGKVAFGKPWLTPVFGVQNVLDRKYVGSVAVNAAGTVTSGKFYEPGPGRTWYIGLSAASAPW
jgi:iron complex outermembrane receptor protein